MITGSTRISISITGSMRISISISMSLLNKMMRKWLLKMTYFMLHNLEDYFIAKLDIAWKAVTTFIKLTQSYMG